MYTKEQAIRIVTQAAASYKSNLSGNNLLFVCINKARDISYIETVFTESRFLHLTGLKVNKEKIGAVDFYKKCTDNKLSPDDFELSDDGTTELKLDVLPFVMTQSLGKANMIGEYNNRNVQLFTEKIVGTVKAGIGFVKQGNSEILVPNTMIKADIREYIKDPHRIIATYSKKINDTKYSKQVYSAKGIDLASYVFPKSLSDKMCLEQQK